MRIPASLAQVSTKSRCAHHLLYVHCAARPPRQLTQPCPPSAPGTSQHRLLHFDGGNLGHSCICELCSADLQGGCHVVGDNATTFVFTPHTGQTFYGPYKVLKHSNMAVAQGVLRLHCILYRTCCGQTAAGHGRLGVESNIIQYQPSNIAYPFQYRI